LMDSDPKDAVAARELAAIDIAIGDALLLDQPDAPEAGEAEYQKALAISEPLANADKENAEWQDALAVDSEKLGDADSARKDIPLGVAAYLRALRILDTLIEIDSANVNWRLDYIDAQWKLALAGDNSDTRVQTVVDALSKLDKAGKLPFGKRGLLQKAIEDLSKQAR
jgi:hypothetical protein